MLGLYPIHRYHKSGLNMGNPAPQTDLLAHHDLGKKTVLFLGDGTYATKQDHCIIGKFNMYPFNGDWTNSLFFSQDPVAIDSVMYDFLHTEGTHPIKGSQNYLHQAANPPDHVYDPENDGEYLSESLGVHEHWNTETNIFSPQRYSGVDADGIDFVAIGSEHTSFGVTIHQPERKYLYISGRGVKPLRDVEHTIIIGKITVKAEVNTPQEQIDRVEFYVDNTLTHTDYTVPYEWQWKTPNSVIKQRNLTVTAVSSQGKTTSDGFTVWKIL